MAVIQTDARKEDPGWMVDGAMDPIDHVRVR